MKQNKEEEWIHSCEYEAENICTFWMQLQHISTSPHEEDQRALLECMSLKEYSRIYTLRTDSLEESFVFCPFYHLPVAFWQRSLCQHVELARHVSQFRSNNLMLTRHHAQQDETVNLNEFDSESPASGLRLGENHNSTVWCCHQFVSLWLRDTHLTVLITLEGVSSFWFPRLPEGQAGCLLGNVPPFAGICKWLAIFFHLGDEA